MPRPVESPLCIHDTPRGRSLAPYNTTRPRPLHRTASLQTRASTSRTARARMRERVVGRLGTGVLAVFGADAPSLVECCAPLLSLSAVALTLPFGGHRMRLLRVPLRL